MKIEIETRFLEIDKAALISKLKELGAVDKGEIMMNDIIFYDQDLKWQKENKIVRLRKKGNITTLTFKENKEQTVDSAKETEFIVSSLEDAKFFLSAVGLRMYRTVEKYRHNFLLDGVTVDIDTWPKIPTYVELEGESVQALENMAQKLGLVWENRFDGDPRFVYKKYGIDLDKITIVTFDKFE
jgi:adenylate cyclase class 2